MGLLLSFFSGCATWHVGLWSPSQGLNLWPPRWKCRALTTVPPGKSLRAFFTMAPLLLLFPTLKPRSSFSLVSLTQSVIRGSYFVVVCVSRTCFCLFPPPLHIHCPVKSLDSGPSSLRHVPQYSLSCPQASWKHSIFIPSHPMLCYYTWHPAVYHKASGWRIHGLDIPFSSHFLVFIIYFFLPFDFPAWHVGS